MPFRPDGPPQPQPPKTPQHTLAEMQEAKEKLTGIRGRATKAQEEGRLSEEGELMLVHIEEKEKALEVNIAELETNIREAEEAAAQAPEEKQPNIWKKINQSYETAKSRINIATGVALTGSVGMVAYGSYLAANSYSELLGRYMNYEGLSVVEQGAKYTFAVAGVALVAHGINKGVEKVREWKADRDENKAYEQKRREAGLAN